jgi:PmbA protein
MAGTDTLQEQAERVVERARALGAAEASVSASQSTSTSIQRRDGRVEQASEATSRGLVLSLLVDDRFSSHSTSDLRPDALEAFLQRALAATRFLEPDPDRAQPDIALCGRGPTDAELDQLDPTYATRTAEQRAEAGEAVESTLRATAPESAISMAAHLSDGHARVARVMSNGFSGSHEEAWFSAGAELTISDTDGRRPEAAAFYGTRYLTDLPAPQTIADEVVLRAEERLGAAPAPSGRYTLILDNRAARQILSTLAGPLSGGSIHHGRSCLADKRGEVIASPLLTIVDDPTVARGLASRPWDGDGLVARPRTVMKDGRLEMFYINVYYGRKLGMDPTTGGRSNWVLPSGDRSWQEIAKDHAKAIRVTGFLGGNANGATGDFSFGVQGTLFEHGQPTQPLAEMNVTGNAVTFFQQLIELGNDPWTYGTVMTPTLVFSDVQFSGT